VDAVFDCGLADTHPQFRKPAADFVDPGVLMQNRKCLGDRFVERLGGDLYGVVGSGEITAVDQAGSEGHEIRLANSPFVRHKKFGVFASALLWPESERPVLPDLPDVQLSAKSAVCMSVSP
jgi:hypothetical protein